MKTIKTKGIDYIEPLDGTIEWYWGMNFTHGDLYEAEEIFRQGSFTKKHKLLFIHYPDGRVIQPVVAKEGQYFGKPIYYNNHIVILIADFQAGEINILELDDLLQQTSILATLSLSNIKDCYNLMLKTSPLMLTRQSSNKEFQILWPEKTEFNIDNRESFCCRDKDKLYFSMWYEEPDYYEEIVIRKIDTGEILDRIPGSLMIMPDGQKWILKSHL
ncbi:MULTISPECIES: hypothetical protein [Anaerotignum]|uniref:hypothetical protein n=1 Tax=Anaerotignum TaxID=2039240 RepID=UPI00210DB500|nr:MULTISPECIES: hypothetical protein [Anaerotignum]MCQ4935243.1 hypothetical protein [Anaerotignum propionicum]